MPQSIPYFFDLSDFSHSAIFEHKKHVWEALLDLKKYLATQNLGKIESEIPVGAYLIDPDLISIGKNCKIEPGAYIKGPCILGEGCTVRHGAYIRGNLVAGVRCVIGHGTEIKHAILLDEVHAAHFAYVGDTILGNRVNLGAGVKCANLKFDKSSIVIKSEGGSIDTGLKKCGAIIGDDSQIGCNVVLNPGTFMGKHVWCNPSLNVKGVIPEMSFVKSVNKIVIRKL